MHRYYNKGWTNPLTRRLQILLLAFLSRRQNKPTNLTNKKFAQWISISILYISMVFYWSSKCVCGNGEVQLPETTIDGHPSPFSKQAQKWCERDMLLRWWMLDDLLKSSRIRNLGACLETCEWNWNCRIVEIEMLNVAYGYFFIQGNGARGIILFWNIVFESLKDVKNARDFLSGNHRVPPMFVSFIWSPST